MCVCVCLVNKSVAEGHRGTYEHFETYDVRYVNAGWNAWAFSHVLSRTVEAEFAPVMLNGGGVVG